MATNWRVMYSFSCNDCGESYTSETKEMYFKGEKLNYIKEKLRKIGWVIKEDFCLCPKCVNNQKKLDIPVDKLLQLTKELTGLSEDKIFELLDKNVKIEK